MGSFIDSLKKMFIYNGTDDEADEQEETTVEKQTPSVKEKPRINLTNPIERIKDMKESAAAKISDVQAKKKSMSDYTKDIIYDGLFYAVEQNLKLGMPVQEARLLFKRFLEEQITDESMYSSTDMKYINELVEHIRYLKAIKCGDNDSILSLSCDIVESNYFLNIVEVLDTKYSLGCMDYCIEHSYVMCGYSYKNNSNLKTISDSAVFPLHINDSTFFLLKEVASLIKDEDSIENKKEYIRLKISPYFDKFIVSNEVDVDILKAVITIFNNASMLNGSTTVEDNADSATVEDEPTVATETPTVEHQPVKTVAASEPTQEDYFVSLYLEMAKPDNLTVTIEELEEAINDIKESVDAGKVLNEHENHIYQSLVKKHRTISVFAGM